MELIIPATTVYSEECESWWTSQYHFVHVREYKHLAWRAWQAARVPVKTF